MAVLANKRSVMTLFMGPADMQSHRVRIVLAEKGVVYDLVNIEPQKPNEELLELNPHGSVPTLVDRDLVLFDSKIIMEYLDERFPHPPLMPVYPVARARSRLMIHRIERDWYSLMDKIEAGDKKAKTELMHSLVSVGPLFNDMPFFMSEDFSLVDCTLAPLLWRLHSLGIHLPDEAESVKAYAKRLFEREAFIASMTDEEQALQGGEL